MSQSQPPALGGPPGPPYVPPSGPSRLPAARTTASSPPGPPQAPLPPAPATSVLPPGPPASASPQPRRRRRVAVVVLSVLLVLVVAASGTAIWYLLRTTNAWHDSSDDWQGLAREHGQEVAALQADLADTRDQLATAQARITELADEKAQLGDESAATQQLADYQARISQAAGEVATALATCISGQEDLIGYMEDAALYDPADLASFRSEVEQYCQAATDANEQLQAELTR